MALKRAKRVKKQRRTGPLPFRYVFLISFLVFVLLTAQGLWFVDKHIRPALMSIAVLETQRVATMAINEAVSGGMTDQEQMDELVMVEQSEDGEIASLAFNAHVYNDVLSDAVAIVQRYMAEVEQGITPAELEQEFVDPRGSGEGDGTIYTIPLGMATNNALLAQLGPRVPVSFSVVGDVHAEMDERIENVGINNTWLRISVKIEMDVRVVIPFGTERDVVTSSIPVGMVFIPGDVPDYYGQGGGMPVPAIIPSGNEEGIEMQPPEAETEEGFQDPEISTPN